MNAMCGQIIVFRVSKYFSEYAGVAQCTTYSDMQDTLNSILKEGQDSERWTRCGTGALSSPQATLKKKSVFCPLGETKKDHPGGWEMTFFSRNIFFSSVIPEKFCIKR